MPDTTSLRRVDRAPMYEAILDRLREYARDAGLKRGHRLPSERDLAEQLGTSRASVKQALVVLEVQGLVETRHGGGTFLLQDELSTETVTALVARQARLPEVMEARMGLECQLAELAARRRSDNDLRLMDDALAHMAREVEEDADGAEGDRLFHRAIASAAQNTLLSRFLGEIDNEVSESRHESLRQPGRPGQSLRQHHAILEAIRRQDAAAARRAMRQHLSSVGKVRLLSWQAPTDDNLTGPE
ncbi:MAG TPA: FCD domain-containing protein [Pedococcus sp.]|nr:FCD domain-containing protein [Pedococcus sp.]